MKTNVTTNFQPGLMVWQWHLKCPPAVVLHMLRPLLLSRMTQSVERTGGGEVRRLPTAAELMFRSMCFDPVAVVARATSLSVTSFVQVIHSFLREDLSTGYGLQFSTEIYGSKREKTVFHKYLQETCFVLTEISESLQKPPRVYERM